MNEGSVAFDDANGNGDINGSKFRSESNDIENNDSLITSNFHPGFSHRSHMGHPGPRMMMPHPGPHGMPTSLCLKDTLIFCIVLLGPRHFGQRPPHMEFPRYPMPRMGFGINLCSVVT